MSDYYVGPFGRMLPAGGPSSDQDQEHPANLPASGNPQYHLPLPRSEALQFGTDPHLHHGHLAGRRGSGISHDRQQTGQQLPSVSQLLTDAPHSSRPSYHPPALGTPIARGPEQPSHSFRHDHSITPPVYDRPTRQAEDLPPISRSVHSPMEQHSPRYTGVNPVLPTQPGFSSYPSSMANLGEISPSETPSTATSMQTQSLPVRPHVVDEKHIDGEGWCYIYADGSYCPKNIDGVPVNANWGVTKAGKPRKRLAQACLTCREKKIKCHPNLPKCDQCQKSGRVCRFENAPRGNRAALKSSHGRYDATENLSPGRNPSAPLASPYSTVRASDSSTSLPGTSGQSPVSESSMRTPSAFDSAHEIDAEQSHRARTQGLNIGPVSVDDTPRPVAAPKYTGILMEMKDIDSEDSFMGDWNADPYRFDLDATTHYIECYFTNINDSLYHIFPRRRFFLWLQSCRFKSLDDKMLLYSMLAMGSVFSDRPDRLTAMRGYSRMARYAVERNQHSLSLQLAQSRIILSLWYYAIGALVKSWDSIGAAVRTVCGLRYNMESGGVIVDQNHACEYGLHPQALMECRRRTFWVAYLMDRLSSFYSQASTFLSSQTAFLRLPCQEEIFEAQQYATVPYFQNFLNKTPSSEDDLGAVSPMAFWIEIASLWGEVVHHVFRLPHVPAESYNTIFDEFYTTIIQRLDEWGSKLPGGLIFTAGNLERSVRARNADSFVSIHLLYHATLMKLNRHARYQNFRTVTVNQHIHGARHHAVEVLRIAAALTHYVSEYESMRPVAESASLMTMVLNPYLGYVIVSAVDVLSAIGLMTDMPECLNLIKSGLDTVRELGRFWDSSLFLVSLIETRMGVMAESLRHRRRLEGKVAFVVDSPSLDSHVSISMLKDRPPGVIDEDLLYGELPRERLFSALGLDDASFSEEHVLRVQDGN